MSLREARCRVRSDDGTAIVEFVFVAVVILVPLVYLVVSVAVTQRNSMAVSNAAREAGRAFATAETAATAPGRAQVAARLALADERISAAVDLRYVGTRASCDSEQITPTLAPGAVFAICVVRTFSLPGVPTLLTGRGVRSIGRYVVHVDDYRTVR